MQSLSGTSVKAIIYKLFVFTKMSTFQYLVPPIAFVIEQHMSDMFHVDTDLMSTSRLQDTFHKRDVSQAFQHTIMSHSVFANCRVGHHCHLHSVFRVTGYIPDDCSLILLHNPPYQGAIFTFGSFIKELVSQICFGVRCLGNHQQPRSIFVDPMNKSHVRIIRIIIGIIFHMPGKRIDQSAMIIPMSRMHYQSGRLIHHHQIGIFINDSKGNIFRDNFIFVTRTVHHHRDNIQRLYFIATFHRLAVGHNESSFGSLLNTVARSIDNTFEQIFVDSDHRLPLIYHHPEVFVKLGLVTDRFYIIQIVLQFIRKFFLYHVSLFC